MLPRWARPSARADPPHTQQVITSTLPPGTWCSATIQPRLRGLVRFIAGVPADARPLRRQRPRTPHLRPHHDRHLTPRLCEPPGRPTKIPQIRIPGRPHRFPLFRGPITPEAVNSQVKNQPSHPHWRWSLGLHAYSGGRAAVCWGMPSCSCYRRVDLRQWPGLCCFCVARSRPAAPSVGFHNLSVNAEPLDVIAEPMHSSLL